MRIGRRPAGEKEFVPGRQLRDRSFEDRVKQRRVARAQQARQVVISRWRQRVRNVLLTIVAGLLGLLVASRLLVNGVQAEAADGSDQPTLQAAAQEYLQASLWRHLKVGINEGDMASYLMTNHPEAGVVSVHVSLFSNTITVRTAGRVSAAVVKTSDEAPAYAIDAAGVVFTQVADDIDLSALPVIRDTSGLTPAVGDTLLPPSTVHFILLLHKRLPDFGLTGVEFKVGQNLRLIEVGLKDQRYILKADSGQGAGEQLAALRYSLGWLDRHKMKPKQYLDVRVQDRVYFK